MLSATRNWFRRHRTTIAVGFGVLSAGYVAAQYISTKLSEARERMSSDRIARENLRRRFQQNQEDCTLTVLALLPSLSEKILGAIQVEKITHELQQKKAERLAAATTKGTGSSPDVPSSELSSGPPSVAAEDDGRSLQSFQSESYVHASQTVDGGGSTGPPEEVSANNNSPPKPKKTKAQLWAELKIATITRTFTLIYSLALLTLFTRIQLNLLGRRSYLSSVLSLASYATTQSQTINLEDREDGGPLEDKYRSDFEVNQRYLTFSWWLLHRGWKMIKEEVEAAVKEVFGSIDPREDISFDRLSELTLQVRKKVEGETPKERRKYLPYLLPPVEQESLVLQESGMFQQPSTTNTSSPDLLLRHLIDETSDLIDSPTFTHVLTQLLDCAFSLLIDEKISQQAYPSQHHKQPQSTPDDQQQSTTPTPPPIKKPPTPSPTTKLANILAVMTRQAHLIGSSSNGGGGSSNNNMGMGMGMGMGPNINEYLRAMDTGARDLEGFSAVVYCEGLEFEIDHPVPPTTSNTSAGGGKEEKEEKVGRDDVDVLAGTEFENVWGKAVAGESR